LPGHDAVFNEHGQPLLAMGQLFDFSEEFIKNYLPYTVELGRAFVQPDYQTAKMGMKSLFSLDNLWDGLGALIHDAKKSKYFIGKINIYEHYSPIARELIYEYLEEFFPDKKKLIVPKNEIQVSAKVKKMAKAIFNKKETAQSNYKLLQKAVRNEGETIPPMFNAYIGLTDTMLNFGTTTDPHFGHTFETGIMITTPDLIESKRMRYIDPYINYLSMMHEEWKVARANRRAGNGVKKRFIIKLR